MNASYSFPPADALISFLRGVNYRKHYNSFMDTVEQICLIIAAVCIILARKWKQHEMTEKLQIFAGFAIVALAIVAAFVKETVWPIVKQTAQNVWQILYTVAHPPLTA